MTIYIDIISDTLYLDLEEDTSFETVLKFIESKGFKQIKLLCEDKTEFNEESVITDGMTLSICIGCPSEIPCEKDFQTICKRGHHKCLMNLIQPEELTAIALECIHSDDIDYYDLEFLIKSGHVMTVEETSALCDQPYLPYHNNSSNNMDYIYDYMCEQQDICRIIELCLTNGFTFVKTDAFYDKIGDCFHQKRTTSFLDILKCGKYIDKDPVEDYQESLPGMIIEFFKA